MVIDVVNPSVYFEGKVDLRHELEKCVTAAKLTRGAKVKEEISLEDSNSFITRLLRKKPHAHDSILEHGHVSLVITCSRACSHQLVRHRIGFSPTQKSTRYCVEASPVRLVRLNPFFPDIGDKIGEMGVKEYFKLRREGYSQEVSRGALPLSLETELYITANFRAIRHFVDLRSTAKASPEIRFIALEIHRLLLAEAYSIFAGLQDLEKE